MPDDLLAPGLERGRVGLFLGFRFRLRRRWRRLGLFLARLGAAVGKGRRGPVVVDGLDGLVHGDWGIFHGRRGDDQVVGRRNHWRGLGTSLHAVHDQAGCHGRGEGVELRRRDTGQFSHELLSDGKLRLCTCA